VNILIVDNSQEYRGLLANTIRFLGFYPDIAASGCEAIQRHIHQRHDLILLSLDLPDFDGCSTAQAIRQLEVTEPDYKPALICGLLRSGCDTGIRENCLKNGMDSCVIKPGTTRDMIDLLVDLRKQSGQIRRKRAVAARR